MRSKIYAASALPEIEYQLLDCLDCEDSGAAAPRELRENYAALEEFSEEQIFIALGNLRSKGLVSFLFPDGSEIALTKLGRDVIQFAEKTAREE